MIQWLTRDTTGIYERALAVTLFRTERGERRHATQLLHPNLSLDPCLIRGLRRVEQAMKILN